MKRRTRTDDWAKAARFLTPILLGALLLSGVVFSGCKERRERRRREREAAALAQTPEEAERAAASGKRPPIDPSATVQTVLAATKAAYSNAKYYSDDGCVEIVCERSVGARRERFSIFVPCSFSFAKPNFFHLEIGTGVVRSNGEKIRAEIVDAARSGEYLETPAPMLLTSVKPLYPDAQLASALDLRVPRNLFWTAPQAILLLAKDPSKTLVPSGATVELLPPEYLRFENSSGESTVLACDRVRVANDDGARVFWIDRRSKSVARIELPIERFAVPENVDRVCEARIEFPNQILSDVAPSDLSAFDLPDAAPPKENGPEIRRVERFLPPELPPLGRSFPNATLRSLDADFPDVRLGANSENADDSPRATLLYFWSATTPLDPIRDERRATFLRELEQTTRVAANGTRLELLSINVDDASVSDETIRDEYRRRGATAPLFRLAPSVLANADFPSTSVPPPTIVDAAGKIRAQFSEPFSSSRLRRRLAESLAAESAETVRDDAFAAYFADVKRFADFIANADETDVYRDEADALAPTPTAIPTRRYPKTFGLREVWTFDGLYAPSNPLAVSATEPEFDSFRAFEEIEPVENAALANDENAENPIATNGENVAESSTAANDENSPSTETVPLAAQELPNDLLVVPCDGNALAILSSSGRLLRKTTPSAAVGEPISFVRTVKYGNGARFYVASARLQSRKIHRFDEKFNDLGSLDVGRMEGRRVGDARFVDVDADGTPELALGLVGDPATNATAPSGLYAVDMKTPKIRWKDESVVEPYRLGVRTRPTQSPPQRLLATNRSEGVLGTIVENDVENGARLAELRAPGAASPADSDSFLTFAVSDATVSGESNVVALLAEANSDALYFVGVGADGSIVWREPLDFDEAAATQMERIVPGDLDGDGVDEWIVATPNGVVRFFAADGKPLDAFHYGAEISGVCVARWDGSSYLIVADLNGIVAWRIEKRR